MGYFNARQKTEPPADARTFHPPQAGRKVLWFLSSKKGTPFDSFPWKRIIDPFIAVKKSDRRTRQSFAFEPTTFPREASRILGDEHTIPARVRCVAVSACRNLDFPERSGGKKIQILARTEQRRFFGSFLATKRNIPMRSIGNRPPLLQAAVANASSCCYLNFLRDAFAPLKI